MRALVTGSNGFVGSAVSQHFTYSGLDVRGALRNRRRSISTVSGAANWETFVLGDISESTEWRAALTGVDVVIHAAARVHVMRDRAADPLAEFRRVNTAGTERLARVAAHYGVRRLVYLSSVKVNGEITHFSKPFRETDAPSPIDPYGVSKFEAEIALRKIEAETGLEVVIVRPTLVYGPNVRGNIAAMLSWAYRGIPLPLAAIVNARSLVALENLCSFLYACATNPAAAGETFMVSDGRAVSTPELFRLLAAGMGKKARLYPVSDRVLKMVCKFCGLGNIYRRLCLSLVVDTHRATERLAWHPLITVEQALERTGQWYLGSRLRSAGSH